MSSPQPQPQNQRKHRKPKPKPKQNTNTGDATPTTQQPRRKAKFNASLTTTESSTPSTSKPKPRNKKPHHRPPAPPEDTSLTTTLTNSLRTPPYIDCPICFNPIHPAQPTWSCSPLIPTVSAEYCWTTFHLKCIRPWAEKSFREYEQALRARGEENVQGEWRCPGCQGRRMSLIRGYLCFCGSSRPQTQPHTHSTPHSCASPCSRPLQSCDHPCALLCHPGPCPPCRVVLELKCGCPRERPLSVKCGDTENEASCGERCNRVLNCGKHTCTRTCHLGACAPCEETATLLCWCEKASRTTRCGEGDTHPDSNKLGFTCTSTCDKPFSCSIHTCTLPCHPHPNAQLSTCPYAPETITTCPCGKTPIAIGSRSSCTDPIPTCDQPCSRPLPSCDHLCASTCHLGACPPCTVEVTRPCRCGGSVKTIRCSEYTQKEGDEILCEKLCTSLRGCGKHQCRRVCCPLASFAASNAKGKKKLLVAVGGGEGVEEGGWHECDLICGKMLSCGLHTCEERCHRGGCGPCLRSGFDELTCTCGRTTLLPPIPCGTTIADVKCPHPCSFPPPECGHPKIPHACHSPEVGCPRCVVLVNKTCACGKKEVGNRYCWEPRERVHCGLVCGRLLSCGFHRCERRCHAEEEGGCGECKEVCGKDRKLCLPLHHPCTLPCHAPSTCDESAPCEALVTISCDCGRVKQNIRCGNSSTNEKGKGKRKERLECTKDCLIQQRNRRLADALGISPSSSASSSSSSAAVYTEELVAFASREREKRFIGAVEGALSAFVSGGKKSEVLTGLNLRSQGQGERRKVVTDLAHIYRLDTHLIDHQDVQVIRRIDSRIPKPLLSEVVAAKEKERGLGRLGELRGGKVVGVSGAGAWRTGTGTGTTGWASVARSSPVPRSGGVSPVPVPVPRSGGTTPVPVSGSASSNVPSRVGTPVAVAVGGANSGVAVAASASTSSAGAGAEAEEVPDSWEDDA